MVVNIILVLALVVIAALVANIITDSRKGDAMSFKESMDLTELPVVTFMNNGIKLNFLLDTGSNMSYINKSMLSRLSYEETGETMNTIGIEGNKVQNHLCRMTVSYKELQFEEEFSIGDLDGAFSVIKQESGVQIHGILGSLFFQKYRYVLDFGSLIAYLK